jgi:hypothetical protein
LPGAAPPVDDDADEADEDDFDELVVVDAWVELVVEELPPAPPVPDESPQAVEERTTRVAAAMRARSIMVLAPSAGKKRPDRVRLANDEPEPLS